MSDKINQIVEGISDEAKKYLWNHPGATTGLLEFALFQFKATGDAEISIRRIQEAVTELEEGIKKEGEGYEW